MKFGLIRSFPLAALSTLAVGWSALWLLASSEAAKRLDAWAREEAEQGRLWNCPDRRIEGFPLQLRLVCERPSFAGPLQGVPLDASLSSLSAALSIWAPTRPEAELGSPIEIEFRENGARASANFQRLRLDLRLAGETLKSVKLSGEKIEARWNEASSDPVQASIAALDVSAEPVNASDGAVDIALASAGLSFPGLDQFTNSSEPARIAASARLGAAAQLLHEGDWSEGVENWRTSGGRLRLDRFSFNKGRLELDLSGEFGLDRAHRLQGRGEFGARGADSVLLRLGVPPAALGIANMLGGLLRDPASAKKGGAPGIRLPLSLENGQGAVGPVRNLFVLEPLY